MYVLDQEVQELISYRYLSCSSSWCCSVSSHLVELLKKPKAPSFQIRSGWNLDDCSSCQFAYIICLLF